MTHSLQRAPSPPAFRPPAPRAPAARTRAPGTTRRRVALVEMNEDFTVGGSYQALYDLARTCDRTRFEPVAVFYQDNAFVARLRAIGVETHVLEPLRAAEHRAHRSGGIAAKLAVRFTAVAARRRWLREHRIDLLHLNNSPRVGGDDWLPASWLAGVPCITYAMGDCDGARGLVQRWLFRRFRRVVAISRHVRDAMAAHGVPRDRIDLVYLGVDGDALRARVTRPRAAVRRELGAGDDTVLAVMVGNIREWKGQHVVLDALARLAPDVRDRLRVAFVGAPIPGDGYGERLQRMVAEHGLAPHVAFLGSRSDVPELFHAADLAIHASTIPEPLGLVVIEAMALGRPVIAAHDGGPPEMLTPETGLVFDTREPAQLAAHLTTLVADAGYREALGRAAPARAAEFSVEANATGIERVWSQLLDRR